MATTQAVPVIPNNDTPVLTPNLGTTTVEPTALLFRNEWYQFLSLLRTALQSLTSQGATVASNIQGPYSASTNITADLYGVPDTRPDTWGYTQSVDNALTFFPPSGMRVRILRVYGNVYIMPKVVDPSTGPYPDIHGYTGMLWGLITTAPGGSARVDFGADSCMAFYQAAMGQIPVGFDFDFTIGDGVPVGTPTMGLLEADNKLINRFASFLNTLQVPIHIESEFVFVYHFESAS